MVKFVGFSTHTRAKRLAANSASDDAAVAGVGTADTPTRPARNRETASRVRMMHLTFRGEATFIFLSPQARGLAPPEDNARAESVAGRDTEKRKNRGGAASGVA